MRLRRFPAEVSRRQSAVRPVRKAHSVFKPPAPRRTDGYFGVNVALTRTIPVRLLRLSAPLM